MPKDIHFKIKRQDGPNSPSYWQEFKIPYEEGHTVITVLMKIRENPVTIQGKRVPPPVWENSCLEEVCGACTMLIDGIPRQACAALVDDILKSGKGYVTVEPLTKFPVIRDLMVDRQRMFDALKQVKAWAPIDVLADRGEFGAPVDPKVWDDRYLFSRCMTCGACMEVCPQVHEGSSFIGPAPLGQVYAQNIRPGDFGQEERLHAIMGDGGVTDCGNAQNCIEVCPKEISLTKAIASLGRQTTVQWLKDIFHK